MKRRVAFVDVPKKNTKRSATSALVYKRGALRASAHARDERLLLRLDAQQRLVLHLQTLEFPPPLARGRGLHRGVASPPLRLRRRLVALAHRAQLLALRRRRLSRRVSSWVREEEARGHGARVSERNRRGRYATRDATSEHAAPSRGDGGDDAPERSPVPPTRKNSEKTTRSFVRVRDARRRRETYLSVHRVHHGGDRIAELRHLVAEVARGLRELLRPRVLLRVQHADAVRLGGRGRGGGGADEMTVRMCLRCVAA